VPGRTILAIVAAEVLGAVLGAGILGVVLAIEGMALGAFVGAEIGLTGGVIFGALFGASVAWRFPAFVARWRARRRYADPAPDPLPKPFSVSPGGGLGKAASWAFALLLVASPWALLSVGYLPPLPPWRMAVTAVLASCCFLACARVGTAWPALLVFLWPAAYQKALESEFPCWRSSNATWCGHSCDGPPEPWCRPRDYGNPEDSGFQVPRPR
jgi:hypothetical protein